MAVKDVFSVKLLKSDNTYEDITSGIFNVDIQHGIDVYEGPWQQIDTGQFSIVSRNPNLDPKINPNIKYNSVIDFMDSRIDGEVFFRGYVTDIDVQYQRDDYPIITITGTDAYGLMQRTLITQDIVDQIYGLIGPSSGDPQFDNGISLYQLTSGFYYEFDYGIDNVSFEYLLTGTPGQSGNAQDLNDQAMTYAPAKYWPAVGESYLEVINKYLETNLSYTSLSYTPNSSITTIKIYPFAKYNLYYWPLMQNPGLEYQTINFSSDPNDGRPYKSILINNGYRRVVNAISISNEYQTLDNAYETQSTNETFGVYLSDQSKTEFGSTRANLNTIMPANKANSTELERYATDIFQVVAFPSDEIQEITFDNARNIDIQNDFSYSSSKLNQFVRILHQVNETETIDRFYDIAGIRHSISTDSWEMSFTFKPSQQEIAYIYQGGQAPTIEMNSLTGDSNFNFTATLTEYPIEDIEKVVWCLNGTTNSINDNWFYSQSTDAIHGLANRYVDGEEVNGLTVTWNFDDDGILNGPDFPTGGYGTGEWYVIAYVFLKNGWVIAPQVKLTVGTPEVTADFTWSQNTTNNFGQVTFTSDSHNHETGEPDSYLWNFGDGTTSNEQNPVHQYDPSPGQTTYNVSLTVFAYGENNVKVYNTKTVTVTLTQPAMTANFTWTANNQVVTFTNTSTNVGFEEPDAYLWNFGDGTTSVEKNPVKNFAAINEATTSYTVTLTVRNIWEQTATVTKTVTITPINTSGTYPVRYIKLSFGPYTTPAAGLRILTPTISNLRARTSNTLANLASLKPSKFSGGDVYTNILPNVPIYIHVDYNGGTFYSSLNPQYAITRDPAQGTSNNFGHTSFVNKDMPQIGTYYNEIIVDLGENRWTINDVLADFTDAYLSAYDGVTAGNKTADFYPRVKVSFATTVNLNSSSVNPYIGGTRVYQANWIDVGYFDLPGGKMNPAQSGRTSATKTMIATRPLPLNIPYFTYLFSNKTVSFTSVETADSYAWTFGDGTTSTLKDPVKTYANYGTYNVTLAVTNNGVVTRTTTEPVIVAAQPDNLNFTYTISNSAPTKVGDTYTFATDSRDVVSYLWNFGDGTTSNLQNPVKVWATAGSKTVTLTKTYNITSPQFASQTFTVTISSDQTGTYGVRYIKLKQNQFNSTGTTDASTYFSPVIGALFATTSAQQINRVFNKNCTAYTLSPSSVPISWFDHDLAPVSTAITPSSESPFLGTFAPDEGGSYNIYPNNSISMGDLNYLGNIYATGLYPKRSTIAGTGVTEWEMVWDLGTQYYDIANVGLRLNRKTFTNLTSTSTKPSYEIYFSSNGTTWTKVANITAPTMTNQNYWYLANVSYPAGITLPLNI